MAATFDKTSSTSFPFFCRLPIMRSVCQVTKWLCLGSRTKKNVFMCLESEVFGNINARSFEETKNVVHNRPFTKFLNTSSLKSTTVFLKPSAHDSSTIQTTTTHCCRCYLIQNNFKTVTKMAVFTSAHGCSCYSIT